MCKTRSVVVLSIAAPPRWSISAVIPSGPGDLRLGKLLIAFRTSSRVGILPFVGKAGRWFIGAAPEYWVFQKVSKTLVREGGIFVYFVPLVVFLSLDDSCQAVYYELVICSTLRCWAVILFRCLISLLCSLWMSSLIYLHLSASWGSVALNLW